VREGAPGRARASSPNVRGVVQEAARAGDGRLSWRYERIDDAGHWLQIDDPARVNELLLEFLA